MIDWQVVATIAAPIVTLFFGAWLNRRVEARPDLVSYYGHVSTFLHRPAGGEPVNVFTHSIVLKNAGRRSATNVRIQHSELPDYNIWPRTSYTVEDLPDGGYDIVIPTMVPNEQLTISYLYFPPTTLERINAGIKCDQGFARSIPVLLQQQYPTWFNFTALALMLAGSVALLYLAYVAAMALIH